MFDWLAVGWNLAMTVAGAFLVSLVFQSWPLLLGRRRVAGSPIGGIRETQEMLDFCAEKNILPDCEMIRMDQINEAYERMERADVRYRFVIDMATLAPAA